MSSLNVSPEHSPLPADVSAETHWRTHFVGGALSGPHWGAEERLLTSYSCTKSGCDVHTNELIIAAFVTQFPLSLIWQTNASVCPRVHVYTPSECVCARARFSYPRSPRINRYYTSSSPTLNPGKSQTLFVVRVHDLKELVCKTGSN